MNKQVNNRRDVSKCFQKNQSLWLPQQREVQVGSAPYVTNYVCVCVHLCLLSRVIDMQMRRQVHVSLSEKMISGLLVLTWYVCICYLCHPLLLSVLCQLITRHNFCPLIDTYTHKQRTKPHYVCTVVLVDCLQKAAHYGFTGSHTQ